LLLIVADTIPDKQNNKTARKDLSDSLGRPHTPCPEVHPFESFVPNPTKNPQMIKPSKESPAKNSDCDSKKV
jgi:hypothetical protein